MNNGELKLKIFNLLKKIPKGKVTTYKALAEKAGLKNPRHTGKIIHLNDHPEIYPCHRVAKSDGSLALGYKFGGKTGQKKRLLSEGVKIINDKIDLSEYLFNFGLLS